MSQAGQLFPRRHQHAQHLTSHSQLLPPGGHQERTRVERKRCQSISQSPCKPSAHIPQHHHLRKPTLHLPMFHVQSSSAAQLCRFHVDRLPPICRILQDQLLNRHDLHSLKKIHHIGPIFYTDILEGRSSFSCRSSRAFHPLPSFAPSTTCNFADGNITTKTTSSTCQLNVSRIGLQCVESS